MFKTIFLVLFLAAKSFAYVGAVSSATAETGRASIEPTDSPFLNPAALPYMKGYILTSGISMASDGKSSRAQAFGLTVTENMSDTIVPTSIAFSQFKSDFSSEENISRDFTLNFGNFIAQHWSAGFGFRYKDDQGPDRRFRQGALNLGTLYTFKNDFGIALVVENLFAGESGVLSEDRLRPSSALGFNWIYRKFARMRMDLASDSSNSWARPTMGLGLESYMNRWTILRIGYQRRNEQQANAYSAGLGFQGPVFAVHYAYFTSPDLESLTRHSVDLAIPIW